MNSGITSKTNDNAGAIAACILAIACLVASFYHVKQLLPLLKEGIKAEAVIIDIKSGAKDSKKAIYQFITDTGKQVTSQDIFQMYIIRQHKGDKATVIYDPSSPETVTADLGPWIWQGPIIFLFGFVFFTTLGILIIRHKQMRN